MSTYIWCEDQGSGFYFWRVVFSVLHPGFIVESKQNNSRLRQAAERITEDENEYYILMDLAVDNPNVLREAKRLRRSVADKQNTHIISLHSFEFSLLSFKMLEKWVFAEDDELMDNRRSLLEFREVFLDSIINKHDASQLAGYKSTMGNYAGMNEERTSAHLLRDITRNTGFETNKSQVGLCFITDCCNWVERQEDDLCGLDNTRLSKEEKIRQIVEYSVLKKAFQEVGL